MLGSVQGGSTGAHVHTVFWLSTEMTSFVGTAPSLGSPPPYRKSTYPLLLCDGDALAQDPADCVVAARSVEIEYARLPYNEALPPEAEAEFGCERRRHNMDGGMISADYRRARVQRRPDRMSGVVEQRSKQHCQGEKQRDGFLAESPLHGPLTFSVQAINSCFCRRQFLRDVLARRLTFDHASARLICWYKKVYIIYVTTLRTILSFIWTTCLYIWV